jgi:hypothetical protein
MSDQHNDDDRQLYLFVPDSETGRRGSDAWFWGEIGPDDDDPLPLVLTLGVKSKRITKEQARELLERYGRDIWNTPDQSKMDDELRAWIRLCFGRPAPLEPTRPESPNTRSGTEA